MAQDGINIRVELDHETDAALRKWAKREERSKRNLVRQIVRQNVRQWLERRAQGSKEQTD